MIDVDKIRLVLDQIAKRTQLDWYANSSWPAVAPE